MKLRYQLFLVSLCLWVLPWGAWQYLKAVDIALRESETQSLQENAALLADRLSLETKLFDDPFVFSQDAEKNEFFSAYAYPLLTAPIIDGYGDEWRNSKAKKYSLANNVENSLSEKNVPVDSASINSTSIDSTSTNTSAQLQVGIYQQKVYFYLTVSDSYIQYYNPSSPKRLSSDYIQIEIFDRDQNSRKYFIRTSAPNNVVAYYYDANDRLRFQHGIKGVWRETAQGYQLEFSINKNRLRHGFRLQVVDQQKESANTIALSPQRTYLSAISTDIQSFIRNFHSPSLTIKVLDAQQWLVAVTNANTQNVDYQQIPWIVEWLYRQLLNSESLPQRSKNPYESYQQYPEITRSIEEGGALRWYRRDGFHNADQYRNSFQRQTLASVAVPIYQQGKKPLLLGYVLVEKTTDQLISLTTSAFGQLFVYTMGAFFTVILVLLCYASWLSLRISRLNRVANAVVDDRGSLMVQQESWPDLTRRDELGDLSRSYRHLLFQVQSYNDYLQTLSSKLSHELRTPIAVVKSSLENMMQVSPGKQDEYYQRAQQGVQRLNNILSAMSAANSVERSVADADFEDVELVDFLNVLTLVYSDTYSDNHIQFKTDIHRVNINVSQDLFAQMMDKLIDNAVDFSLSDKPITIILSSRQNKVLISVENMGPLLPEKMQGSLFGSMISVREGAEAQGTHLGLGLYIVRLIAECHGGEVMAKNRSDGRGVIFSVLLPYG